MKSIRGGLGRMKGGQGGRLGNRYLDGEECLRDPYGTDLHIEDGRVFDLSGLADTMLRSYVRLMNDWQQSPGLR